MQTRSKLFAATVLLAVSLIFLGSHLVSEKSKSSRKPTSSITSIGTAAVSVVECNPYSLPGVLFPSYVWTPLFPQTESLPSVCNLPVLSDNLGVLKNSSNPLPLHLQNKLILFIGDSFERKLLEDSCDYLNVPLHLASLNGSIWHQNNGYLESSKICTITRGNSSLVLINVFHFGVVDAFNQARTNQKHWHVNHSPPFLKDRIQWIPNMLRSIAKELYPSLCPKLADGITIDDKACPDPVFQVKNDSEPRRKQMIQDPPFYTPNHNPFWFPIPDLVVAQSSIWDFQGMGHDDADIVSWSRLVAESLISPVAELFGPLMEDVVGKARDGNIHWYPRLLARTAPLVSPNVKSAKFDKLRMHKMNNVIRSGVLWKKLSTGPDRNWGVLDWDDVTRGFYDWKDGYHPGIKSNKVYLQMVLAGLEALEIGKRELDLP
ncbi:UNVERIFIED_CONTAM: hypothetical protein HDU68_010165 [Siphonaria sp. JEL0065]|nr:hypothetical protein HDU68_010165 [Siphonaria sp. JEL0065]